MIQTYINILVDQQEVENMKKDFFSEFRLLRKWYLKETQQKRCFKIQWEFNFYPMEREFMMCTDNQCNSH